MQINTFEQLNIDSFFIDKLYSKNITIPTKIQQEVIPRILKEKDVIAQSETGTGKTIAYIVPLLQLLLKNRDKILIIAPTNELLSQIYKEITFFAKNLPVNIILLSGGKPIEKQVDNLKKKFDIIIGVPGRILKLVEQGNLKLSIIKKNVLDEADFLIDLGFLEDIKKIFSFTKNITQLMVFSATLSQKTKKILDIIHTQKYSARVNAKNMLPKKIENYFFPIKDSDREKTLLKLINNINPYLCIIFVRTKELSNWLFKILKEKKILVGCLNGSLTHSQRKRSIQEFRDAKIQYLVATDLASRGLDVESITHIINYNLPVNELDYLHRAGRTGRMNDNGLVYSLCNELDEGYLKKYAVNLNFELKPVDFKNDKIQIYFNYKGVKPRFNITELKQKEKIKQKEKEKNGKKKKRNKKR